MRIDYAAVADFGIILNNSKGLNSNIAANLCLLGYISIRTDNTLNLFLRTEQLQQCGKGCTRVGNSDNRASVKLRVFGTENHYAGLAEMTVLYMRRHRKGNILRSCLNQSVNAGNAQFGVIMLYRAFKILLILVHSSPFHTSTIKPLTQKADGLSARFRVLLISFCNYVTGNIGTALRNGTLV